jgi:hypothetical protein
LQQFLLAIQQVFRDQVVSRDTDRPFTASVTERTAACLLEPFARQVVDAQIHRVPHQKAEHDAAVEQPDAAEHPARHRSKRAEQIEHEILKAGTHRHGSEPISE